MCFQRLMQPTADETAKVKALQQRVTSVVSSVWRTARTLLFGSRATGLGLPQSDLDIVVFGARGGGAIHRLANVRHAG